MSIKPSKAVHSRSVCTVVEKIFANQKVDGAVLMTEHAEQSRSLDRDALSIGEWYIMSPT